MVVFVVMGDGGFCSVILPGVLADIVWQAAQELARPRSGIEYPYAPSEAPSEESSKARRQRRVRRALRRPPLHEPARLEINAAAFLVQVPRVNRSHAAILGAQNCWTMGLLARVRSARGTVFDADTRRTTTARRT